MSVELLISIGIPIVLIVVGRFVGSSIERNHYESIVEREARFRGQPALSTKQLDAPTPYDQRALPSGRSSSPSITSSAS